MFARLLFCYYPTAIFSYITLKCFLYVKRSRRWFTFCLVYVHQTLCSTSDHRKSILSYFSSYGRTTILNLLPISFKSISYSIKYSYISESACNAKQAWKWHLHSKAERSSRLLWKSRKILSWSPFLSRAVAYQIKKSAFLLSLHKAVLVSHVVFHAFVLFAYAACILKATLFFANPN